MAADQILSRPSEDMQAEEPTDEQPIKAKKIKKQKKRKSTLPTPGETGETPTIEGAPPPISETLLQQRARTMSADLSPLATLEEKATDDDSEMDLHRISDAYRDILEEAEADAYRSQADMDRAYYGKRASTRLGKSTQADDGGGLKTYTSWMDQARGSSLIRGLSMSHRDLSMGSVITNSLRHRVDDRDSRALSTRFGSRIRASSSVEVPQMPNLSDVSLAEEYKIEKKMRTHACQVRPIVVTIPVNLKAVQSQYKDIQRGDIVILHKNDLDPRQSFAFAFDDTAIDATKIFRVIWETVKRILRYGPKTKKVELKTYEFLAMLFFHEVNVARQLDDFHLYTETGPVIGIVVNLLEIVVIDAPIMMIVLTMGSYSRFQFLKFFNAIPLLKGMGYWMFVLYVLATAKQNYVLELGAVFAISVTVHRNEWQHCTFVPEGCIPFPTNVTHNDHCPMQHTTWDGVEHFATQHFIDYLLHRGPDWTTFNMETFLTYGVFTIMWVIIFFMSLGGLYRSRRILIKLQLFFAVPIVAIFLYMLLLRITNIDLDVSYHWMPLWKFKDTKYLIEMLALTTKFQQAPFLVWLSTLKPHKLDPENTTLIVMGMKLVWQLLAGLALQASVFSTIAKYKINPDCFILTNFDVCFAMVPDYFLGMHFAALATSVWMVILTFYLCAHCIYAIQMTIDAICQVLPVFRRYPLILSTSLCALYMAVLRILDIKSVGDSDMLSMFKFNASYVLTFFVFVLGLKFCYTWLRFTDDYMYIYGRYPANYWGIWLTAMSYVSLISIGLIIWSEVYVNNMKNKSSLVCICTLIVITVPFFLRHICIFIYQGKFHKSSQPDVKWLPFDETLAKYRRFYFSERDIKERHRIMVCKHKCLRLSERYKVMAKRQQAYQKLVDPSRTTPIIKRESHVKHKAVAFRGIDDDTEGDLTTIYPKSRFAHIEVQTS